MPGSLRDNDEEREASAAGTMRVPGWAPARLGHVSSTVRLETGLPRSMMAKYRERKQMQQHEKKYETEYGPAHRN
jgi:hypothetical protein